MALDEAARQLKSAAHDAQVAFDCLGLGDLERAQIHAITARTAADAAEAVLREALSRMPAGDAEIEGEQAVLDAEGGSSDGSVIASSAVIDPGQSGMRHRSSDTAFST